MSMKFTNKGKCRIQRREMEKKVLRKCKTETMNDESRAEQGQKEKKNVFGPQQVVRVFEQF